MTVVMMAAMMAVCLAGKLVHWMADTMELKMVELKADMTVKKMVVMKVASMG